MGKIRYWLIILCCLFYVGRAGIPALSQDSGITHTRHTHRASDHVGAINTDMPALYFGSSYTSVSPFWIPSKLYVDAQIAGLVTTAQHTNVAAVAVANRALTGLTAVDGVALATGTRVLIENNTSPIQNGIYTAAFGAWTRATDMDATSEAVAGQWVIVTGGTLYANTGYYIVTGPATLDVNDMVWANFTSVGGGLFLPLTGGTMTGIPAFNGGTSGSTAPFTVDSTFITSNLNSDFIDGYHAANTAGAVPINNGTVNSTLNSDELDGLHEASFFQLAQDETVTGVPAFNGGLSGATAPFTVDSTFLVTNLNTDLLDGKHYSDATSDFVNVTGDTMIGQLYVNYSNAIRATTSAYINFGATSGNGGYGIRDNAGVIEVKDNGLGWLPIGSGGGSPYLPLAGVTPMTGVLNNGTTDGSHGSDVNFYGTYSSATGSKMFWDASQDAFMVGRVTGTQWDAPGVYSFASGYNTKASGAYSTAMGTETTASGQYSTAFGYGSTASNLYTVAIGYNNTASGSGGIAVGQTATANGQSSLALGSGNVASAIGTVAVGNAATASGQYSTAIGREVTAGTAADTIVIGKGYYTGATWQPLINNIASSFMLGFDSAVPTFFVSAATQGAASFGKVGISTSSPIWPLTVAGTMYATGTIIPTSGYMNFGTTSGSAGFGLRDNSGTVEYRNTGGMAWTPITAGGGVSGLEDVLTVGAGSNEATTTIILHDNSGLSIDAAGPIVAAAFGVSTSGMYVFDFSTNSLSMASNGAGTTIVASGPVSIPDNLDTHDILATGNITATGGAPSSITGDVLFGQTIGLGQRLPQNVWADSIVFNPTAGATQTIHLTNGVDSDERESLIMTATTGGDQYKGFGFFDMTNMNFTSEYADNSGADCPNHKGYSIGGCNMSGYTSPSIYGYVSAASPGPAGRFESDFTGETYPILQVDSASTSANSVMVQFQYSSNGAGRVLELITNGGYFIYAKSDTSPFPAKFTVSAAGDVVWAGSATGPESAMTADGCVTVEMDNESGGTLTQGRAVRPSTASDSAFILTAADASDTIGFIQDASCADDARCNIGVAGKCYVKFGTADTCTRSYYVYADNAEAGYADCSATQIAKQKLGRNLQDTGAATNAIKLVLINID